MLTTQRLTLKKLHKTNLFASGPVFQGKRNFDGLIRLIDIVKVALNFLNVHLCLFAFTIGKTHQECLRILRLIETHDKDKRSWPSILGKSNGSAGVHLLKRLGIHYKFVGLRKRAMCHCKQFILKWHKIGGASCNAHREWSKLKMSKRNVCHQIGNWNIFYSVTVDIEKNFETFFRGVILRHPVFLNLIILVESTCDGFPWIVSGKKGHHNSNV